MTSTQNHTIASTGMLACAIRTAHSHPEEFYRSVRIQYETFGWIGDDEYIELHESPDARAEFERIWGEPPMEDYFEDFSHQMRYLYDRGTVQDLKEEEEEEERSEQEAEAFRAQWEHLSPQEAYDFAIDRYVRYLRTGLPLSAR
jgi:hypothetical protein